ncbi:MAG: hypothetical protein GY945_03820 [Rhodobacteraceae bacterium]|nr:hypothetical protein [Paracoccaceae bacterium]
MVARLASAIARAFLMVMLIATPALMMPAINPDTAQIVALLALIAGAITFSEYVSTYPGLVEFRDAPPFNRIRFICLFATVFLLSMIAGGQPGASDLTQLVQAVGARIGDAMDFPYSPVNLVVMVLPEDTPIWQVQQLRTAAGLAYLISLLSIAALFLALKVLNWPNQYGAFNVWVNLPTFDPTSGADVVYRLERDAIINTSLGFLLPFILPAIITNAGSLYETVTLTNGHTMIWMVSAWAFLPASLFMRGIAMGRIAGMIRNERRKNLAQEQDGSILQPA